MAIGVAFSHKRKIGMDMKKSDKKNTDEYLADFPDWQRKNLETFRKSIHSVIPDVKEEIKWGVPVFVCNSKALFAMASFKGHTKYNFIHNGALIDDQSKLFNNGFDSKKSRAIDLREGEKIDNAELKKLIERAYQSM